jgi:hypothetical protein
MDHGRSGSVLVFAHEYSLGSMVLFGKKERARTGQLKSRTKKPSERGRAFSRWIKQKGSRVNTLDVSRVEAQSRSDSLHRDAQAYIRFAARSERMAPAGPIQLVNRVQVTRDDDESSRSR